MQAFKMCLNWKVFAALGGVAIAVLVFAPHYTLAVLPFLLLAVCPLSMILMMLFMGKGMGNHGGDQCSSDDTAARPSAESIRARLGAVREEERRLEQQLAAEVHQPARAGEAELEAPLSTQRPTAIS